MITGITACFKKASLGLDLKTASKEEQAWQVSHATKLGLIGRQESNGTACDSVKNRGHVGETEQLVVSKMGHHREEGHYYRLEKREAGYQHQSGLCTSKMSYTQCRCSSFWTWV